MTVQELKTAFETAYNQVADAVYFAPGRVNLIGEHTDYNGGSVFPCALSFGTYLLLRKNEILLDILQNLSKLSTGIDDKTEPVVVLKAINKMQDDIRHNIEHDNNWKRFAENFDLVYENYLTRLGESFPNLTISDKKLCAYLKMDLSSKDIAPLLNMSFRSVEMSRYRLRKKIDLGRDINLAEFLQNF